MNIAAVLFSLGYHFESTREYIKNEHERNRARRMRDSKVERGTDKNIKLYGAIDEALEKLSISPAARGAAGKILKLLPPDLQVSLRTIQRRLREKTSL